MIHISNMQNQLFLELIIPISEIIETFFLLINQACIPFIVRGNT